MNKAIVVLAALTTCAVTLVSAEECVEPLLSFPDAQNVSCHTLDGTHQISYVLDVPYPGDAALQSIRQRLEVLGWLSLAEDFLNPGLQSAHFRGWVDFGDLTTDPHRTVHQWMGDWVDLEGRVLRYVFRYVYPLGGPKDLDTLQVVGILIPKAMARAEREDVVNNKRQGQ